MAEKKKAASEAKKTKQKSEEFREDTRERIVIAIVNLPPQYSALNVRAEPNGAVVGTLHNGETVEFDGDTIANGETWSKIGEKQFVKAEFLKFE